MMNIRIIGRNEPTEGIVSRLFIAAVPYAFKGDVKMTVYWIAAGVLTLAVTWL